MRVRSGRRGRCGECRGGGNGRRGDRSSVERAVRSGGRRIRAEVRWIGAGQHAPAFAFHTRCSGRRCLRPVPSVRFGFACGVRVSLLFRLHLLAVIHCTARPLRLSVSRRFGLAYGLRRGRALSLSLSLSLSLNLSLSFTFSFGFSVSLCFSFLCLCKLSALLGFRLRRWLALGLGLALRSGFWVGLGLGRGLGLRAAALELGRGHSRCRLRLGAARGLGRAFCGAQWRGRDSRSAQRITDGCFGGESGGRARATAPNALTPTVTRRGGRSRIGGGRSGHESRAAAGLN